MLLLSVVKAMVDVVVITVCVCEEGNTSKRSILIAECRIFILMLTE